MNKKELEKRYNLDNDVKPGTVTQDPQTGTMLFHNGTHVQKLDTSCLKRQALVNTGG